MSKFNQTNHGSALGQPFLPLSLSQRLWMQDFDKKQTMAGSR